MRQFRAYDHLQDWAGRLYRQALVQAPKDVVLALARTRDREKGLAREIMELVVNNIEIAEANDTLICQDTGLPIYWVKVGSGVALNLHRVVEAIRRGVEEATRRFALRSSVCHPLSRQNPQTNTGLGVPVVHFEALEDGDYIEIHALPKGSGSENQTFFTMLDPAQGLNGVKQFVVESVLRAGPKGCPPYVVGVGLGGSADLCMWLAKKALFRKIGEPHPDPEVAALEKELLEYINQLGIGPQGLGGHTTAMAVHTEYAYTHISQNPVAVNLQCWRGLRAGVRLYWDGREEVVA
jgi:fumarate hydratase subunit alpha/L(+)-tartrate dehydratase alpha subunit